MFKKSFHSKRELKDLILAKEICFIQSQNLFSMSNVRDMMNMTFFFHKICTGTTTYIIFGETSKQNPFLILYKFHFVTRTLFSSPILKGLEKLF